MVRHVALFVAFLFRTAAANDHVDLATFDGAQGTTFKWTPAHFPTMGGLSNMTPSFESASKALRLAGKVGSQKPLNAGYCSIQTGSGITSHPHFNDASNFTHMQIRARSSVNCSSYKLSFGADKSLFTSKTYKAAFALPADGAWHTVAIPFSDFTNDANTFTGDCTTVPPSGHKTKCCAESTLDACPSLKSLQGITQLGIWMQGVGVDGQFDLEVQAISAGVAGPNDKPIAPYWPPKRASSGDAVVV